MRDAPCGAFTRAAVPRFQIAGDSGCAAPLCCGGHYSHGIAPNNPLAERLNRATDALLLGLFMFYFLILTI
jgi:hypothetical protein